MIQANDPARPPIRVVLHPVRAADSARSRPISRGRRTSSARPRRRAGRLIVLPELASTGYVFESDAEAAALAEPVPDGPTTRAWAALAAELGVHIVAGIAESRRRRPLQRRRDRRAGGLHRHLPQGASLGPGERVLRQGRPRLPGLRHGARQGRRRDLLRRLVPRDLPAARPRRRRDRLHPDQLGADARPARGRGRHGQHPAPGRRPHERDLHRLRRPGRRRARPALRGPEPDHRPEGLAARRPGEPRPDRDPLGAWSTSTRPAART